MPPFPVAWMQFKKKKKPNSKKLSRTSIYIYIYIFEKKQRIKIVNLASTISIRKFDIKVSKFSHKVSSHLKLNLKYKCNKTKFCTRISNIRKLCCRLLQSFQTIAREYYTKVLKRFNFRISPRILKFRCKYIMEYKCTFAFNR